MLRRFATRILDAQGWAAALGDPLQRFCVAVFKPVRFLKDFLNGTWLGHSLHATITDVPVGAFTVAIILDIANVRTGADVAIAVGILGMLGAALAGWADYADTYGKTRDYGTIHQVGMLVAFVLYVASLWLRLGSGTLDRTLPFVLSIVGYVIVAAFAYVGGEMVYAQGNMVDRHAFREFGTKWAPVDVTAFEPDKPTKAKAGSQAIVVVRKGERLLALHDVCSHAGCSLSEGTVVGDALECGCHGSRFDLATGHVVQGPATFDQPRYEIRQAEGRIEARRA